MERQKAFISRVPSLKLPCLSNPKSINIIPATTREDVTTVKYPKSFVRSTSFGNFYGNICSKRLSLSNNCHESSVSNKKIQERLKNSVSVYKDYKEIINPPINYIESLCPISLAKKVISHQMNSILSPKEEYDSYKKDTMRVFRKSEFRIRKARRSILLAKQISVKNIYNNLNFS